jgi:hypothetical protein
MEAELFHAEGQTDMKIIVVFRNFSNAPKNPRLYRKSNPVSSTIVILTNCPYYVRNSV